MTIMQRMVQSTVLKFRIKGASFMRPEDKAPCPSSSWVVLVYLCFDKGSRGEASRDKFTGRFGLGGRSRN